MKKVSILVTILAVLAMAIVPTFAQDEEATIADLVVASATGDSPEFTVLLSAVQAADPAVLEALSDPEAELTVFAPTDAAFAALIAEIGDAAIGEILADPELLTSILLYHVVEGWVYSEDVVAALEENDGKFTVQSLNGQYLDVASTEDGVAIDQANVVLEMVDIEAANGVIHVIDAVLLPETRTIAEIVVAATEADEAQFTTLLAGVGLADPAILEALSDPEAELTVFAPTDAAFAAVPADLLSAVLADQALLTSILQYHVLAGVVGSGDLVPMLMENEGTLEIEMLDGNIATVTLTEEGATINEANIVLSMTDIDAVNGIIHVIDAVILPPSE